MSFLLHNQLMDQNLGDRILNLISSSSIFLLIPIVFIILFNYIISRLFEQRSLPPGPRPWPVIGNIHQLEKKLHISIANLFKIYGPLMSLKLGTQVVIVASSPSTAAEILKNHDRLLSERFVRKALPGGSEALEHRSLVWNPTCSGQWKLFRSLSRTVLFSAKAIESQASLREKKLIEMIEFLKAREGEAVNIGEIVFATVFNTISNLLLSRDLIGFEDEGKAKSTLWKIMEMLMSPNISEFYPILEPLDLQGLKRKVGVCLEEMFGVWEIYIKKRRERPHNDAHINDFLDVFLANGFDDDQINWLVLEFLGAGSDTTTTTIEWAMAELLKNKQAMEKLEQELEREINTETIDKSRVSHLPYLNACVKETLRLHPPAPFLLPHQAPEVCKIMDYTIPKHAQLLVNVWAIGRDSSTWEDPLSFKPERFLTTDVDFKGRDFGLIPFSSGRRICPGLPMAARQLPLILGYLIGRFSWSVSNCDDPSNLNMSEKFGITLQKEQPLHVIPRRKL